MNIKKVTVFDYDEKLSKSIAALLKGEDVVAITDKKGKYYGIIDDKNIRLGFKDPAKVKNSTAAVRAPKILEDKINDVEKIMSYFISGHFNALVVVNKKLQPIGKITRIDILKELLDRDMLPKISVSSIMASPLYTISSDETFGRLKRLMKELKVHGFAVIEKGKIIGIVSSYDLLMFMEKPRARHSMQLITTVKNPDSLKVAQFIREKVVKVDELEELPEAVKKMWKNNVSHAICTDSKGNAKGVITATDLFKLILKIITPKPPIFISGLYGEDLFYYEDIRDSLENEIKKISKFVDVGDINLKIKKGKKMYKMMLSMSIDGEPVHIHEEDHDLITGTNKIIKSINKISKKLKSKLVQKRK